MGYEIAGGLGVKLAAPADEVFVLVGDGSYLMLSGEIATAVQEGLKLIVVVLENHAFQSIHNLSQASGGRNPFNTFRRRDPATARQRILLGEDFDVGVAHPCGGRPAGSHRVDEWMLRPIGRSWPQALARELGR